MVCDAWLSLDYTVSNASVANLLLISFDRYMCVTRPLKYRVRRTSHCAILMISTAWVVSALLWTPWIVAWPFIDVSIPPPSADPVPRKVRRVKPLYGPWSHASHMTSKEQVVKVI